MTKTQVNKLPGSLSEKKNQLTGSKTILLTAKPMRLHGVALN
jgi:hypothetical protein